MVVLLKTTSVWVSFIQIMQVRVQNKGNSVCNNIESGFERVSTLDPTYLENVQSYGIFDKSGFG